MRKCCGALQSTQIDKKFIELNTLQLTKLKTNSTGWAKDGQSIDLIKPSLHLMTVKFNSTGEAQNMSSKLNKNKETNQCTCSFRTDYCCSLGNAVFVLHVDVLCVSCFLL